MSSFNIKSRVLAARDTTAIKGLISPNEGSPGVLREAVGADQIPADGAKPNVRLVSIPSCARISDIEYAKETTGTSALDVTAWYPTDIPQGGANAPAASLETTTISSSAFATNITGVDPGLGWTSAFGLAATPTLQARTQPLWQLLGLSSDPGIDIDLGFSVRTAAAEAGYVGMRVKYVL